MIRLGLFADRGFAAANLATFLLYVGLTGLGFYLPMAAMALWGVTPVEVTLAFLPVSICIALGSPAAGRLADRIGPGWPMTLGAGLVALAYAAIAFAPGDFWTRILPAQLVSGVGLALLVAPLTAAVMARAPEAEQGAASGINNATARVAALVAVALMGRVALEAYGPTGPGLPGFGLQAQGAAHHLATSAALMHMAGLAGLLALAAALTSAWGLLRR